MSTCQVANVTLTNVQSCFRSALDDVVEDEILESNPLSRWAYNNREQFKEEDNVAPFTREEQLAILTAARGETWPQLRLHDAIRWRESNVGRQAARPQRLGPDRQGSWSLDALR